MHRTLSVLSLAVISLSGGRGSLLLSSRRGYSGSEGSGGWLRTLGEDLVSPSPGPCSHPHTMPYFL